MKVAFLLQVLTPYMNAVMNCIQEEGGVDVLAIVPTQPKHFGAGVRQEREGVRFKVCELPEVQTRKWMWRFKGLWRVLWRDRPDIVVSPPVHVLGFAKYWNVRLVMFLLGIKLVMRSIPFQLPLYHDLATRLRGELRGRLKAPSPLIQSILSRLKAMGRVGVWMGVALNRLHFPVRWLVGRYWVESELRTKRLLYRFPCAHLTYIDDGIRIISSYGVPRERIYPTYNSPDTDALLRARDTLLREGVERKPHRIIHVGRLADWKRVDLLILALKKVRAVLPDADLVVIGNGPSRDGLRQLAEKEGVGDVVKFVDGEYEPMRLGWWFMSSAVYVLAGMGGLSINEAMCFELPVICSVCDGTEKHLVVDGGNGFFFREGDADDLACKILAILGNPAVATGMGKESLAIISGKVNLHSVTARFIKAFDIIKEGPTAL
jgi:glycosyltransferase involved in cell wall biosynthesis